MQKPNTVTRRQQLRTLIQQLALSPTAPIDLTLLDSALTHPSFSPTQSYQQLEFVGDSVVRLVAAEVLMENYPNAPVGDFAALRSIMVSDRTLAEFADHLCLESYLLQSEGAISDRAGRVSRLADAFEALLGALYLSTHDMSLIRPWLDTYLKPKAEEIYQDPARQNYKDALQEWSQAVYRCLPHYKVQAINPIVNDEERFLAEVWLQNRLLGKGKGRSKKASEQAAAKSAFLAIKPDEEC